MCSVLKKGLVHFRKVFPAIVFPRSAFVCCQPALTDLAYSQCSAADLLLLPYKSNSRICHLPLSQDVLDRLTGTLEFATDFPNKPSHFFTAFDNRFFLMFLRTDEFVWYPIYDPSNVPQSPNWDFLELFTASNVLVFTVSWCLTVRFVFNKIDVNIVPSIETSG